MASRPFLPVAVLALCIALPSASRATAFTALHPEEALPDSTEPVSEDAYTGFIKNVQERLRMLGFDAGPANGDFGHKTQTALAQFQLSRTIPASGSLDDETLAELGLRREVAEASAGASVPVSAAAEPMPPGSAEDKPEPRTGEKAN